MEPYIIQTIVWAAIVIVAVVVEISTVNLTSVWFAIAGVVSLVLALFKVDLIWQVVVFLVVSILALIFTRPLIKKLTRKSNAHTNADRIFDKVAVVTKTITKDEIGEVQIDDDTWRAISSKDDNIEVGEKVIINSFDGNKVIVSKVEN